MAKPLAEFSLGSRDCLGRIDLGEFRTGLSTRRLVGDPLAPEPAARSGLLTAPVRERPFPVVLLDEVAKAHENGFDLLLPLLDESRIVRGPGRDPRRPSRPYVRPAFRHPARRRRFRFVLLTRPIKPAA